jgi:hypothetical protein
VACEPLSGGEREARLKLALENEGVANVGLLDGGIEHDDPVAR